MLEPSGPLPDLIHINRVARLEGLSGHWAKKSPLEERSRVGWKGVAGRQDRNQTDSRTHVGGFVGVRRRARRREEPVA